MSVRPPSPPVHFAAHYHLSSPPLPPSCRRSRSPTLPPYGSPAQRCRLTDSYSEEEEEDEDEDEDSDPPEDEEDIPDEAIQPNQSPSPSAHSVGPGFPLHFTEPDSPPLLPGPDSSRYSPIPFVPRPPPEVASSPLSPGSDVPSEVASESADYGEMGRIWQRFLVHGVRIRALLDRLEGVSTEGFEDLRSDMGSLVGRYVAMRELEREVLDLKIDRTSHRIEIASVWREIESLQRALRDVRRDHG